MDGGSLVRTKPGTFEGRQDAVNVRVIGDAATFRARSGQFNEAFDRLALFCGV
jgi:hypothetical protein